MLLRWICDPVWLGHEVPWKSQKAKIPFNVFGAIGVTAFGQSQIDVVFGGNAWGGTLTRMSG
jgi:hypothetical protein